MRSQAGQSTAEFAIVMAAILAVVVAVGALATRVGDGLLTEHAIASASHHLAGGVPDVIVDVLRY